MHQYSYTTVKKNVEYFLKKSTFSGICASVFQYDKENRIDIYYGKIKKGNSYIDVTSTTFFDLASLTKPFVTLLSVLSLIKDNTVQFSDTLDTLLEMRIEGAYSKITLLELLGHRSGLSPHMVFYKGSKKRKKEEKRDEILTSILQSKLHEKGAYIYSDLDYILLGMIIEKKTGSKLGSFWRRQILAPLGINSEFYIYSDKKDGKNLLFLETGYCSWSGKILQGIVHDDNCRYYGEMMGHAGLFATLNGVFGLCSAIFAMYYDTFKHPFIENRDLRFVIEKRDSFQPCFGFDVPTGERPSSGSYFSKKSIGHLGFTGTSFWIDLLNKFGVILLTNRVLSDKRGDKIRLARPIIHDALVCEILKKVR